MNDNEFWVTIVLACMGFSFFGMVFHYTNEMIKNHHKNKLQWGNDPDNIPPMFEKMTDKVMEERDAELDDLKERVATLERLVTEHHHISESQKLANEIDNLQEK